MIVDETRKELEDFNERILEVTSLLGSCDSSFLWLTSIS